MYETPSKKLLIISKLQVAFFAKEIVRLIFIAYGTCERRLRIA